jgi:hypothetical protein
MYTALKSEILGEVKESESHSDEEDGGLILEGESSSYTEPDPSLIEVQTEVNSLREYLMSLSSKGSLTETESKKIYSISDPLIRIKNLIKETRHEEEQLKLLVSDLVFGGLGDKKSKQKKFQKIDSLFYDLTESTIESLIEGYINEKETQSLSLEEIYRRGGILDINLEEGLNGISGRDIGKIYNFDSTVGSGLQQRGRGETLFSLAFNSIKNDLAGGDVRSRDTDRVIEIKSSNNAGITPKSGPPISLGGEEILRIGAEIFDIDEMKKKRIQKTSSDLLVSKIEEGGEKAEEFLKSVSEISGVENPGAEDILPIILLLQLDYYSKDLREFQTFAVFIEKGELPEKLVILESDEKTFLSQENISILRESKLSPKVTSSDRVEIYMKKERKTK